MLHLEDARHLVEIHQPIIEKDSVGQEKETFTLYQKFWASKYEWQNREQYEGKNLIDSNVWVFKIYYDVNITSNHIIIFDSRIFQIRGIKEIGYKEALEITAQYKSNK
ncbi:head-tail adaptor [Algoriphagus sp. 4150]|uniref:head-tail adaptor protein n=1 Tax=Algoriphagus sp. 4150 TaxID=2817756 RepID=UPI00285BA973|nr:head-tail adaptor protein [Algoriphagus sp. 4150]MDR7130691.1 head-tail adaptor [Algoriphagus sp. 4150]